MLGGAREFRYDWILLGARDLPHEAPRTLLNYQTCCAGIERWSGERSHVRNSHYSRTHHSGDCCSSMVGLSLTDAAERIAANVAKLPVS
jgi:hypothetical protein